MKSAAICGITCRSWQVPINHRAVCEILVVSQYYDSHGGGIERTVRRLVGEFAGIENFHITWAASKLESIARENEGPPFTASTDEKL